MNPFTPSTPILFPQPTQGIAIKSISANYPGRVSCQASQWKAKLYWCDSSIQILPHQQVEIIGREGITLLVLPA